MKEQRNQKMRKCLQLTSPHVRLAPHKVSPPLVLLAALQAGKHGHWFIFHIKETEVREAMHDHGIGAEFEPACTAWRLRTPALESAQPFSALSFPRHWLADHGWSLISPGLTVLLCKMGIKMLPTLLLWQVTQEIIP